MTTSYNFIDNPLPILYSARVRLSDKQRDQLKAAHAKLRGQYTSTQKPVMSGSTLTVESQTEAPLSVYQKYGFSPLVVSDLITSRDSITLVLFLKLQAMFGIELISRKELLEAFENYLNYIGI